MSWRETSLYLYTASLYLCTASLFLEKVVVCHGDGRSKLYAFSTAQVGPGNGGKKKSKKGMNLI